MLNIPDLESRWFKYKMKSKTPIFLFSLFAIFSFIITVYFVLNEKVPANNLLTQTKNITIGEYKSKSSLSSVSNVNEKTILKPALAFENKYNTKSHPLYIPKSTFTIRDEKKLEPDNVMEKEIVTPAISKQKNNLVSLPQEDIALEEVILEKQHTSFAKPMLMIDKRDTEKDLQDVINRFKKNKNPKLSLHIAKKYYSLGKFNKSYNYALITNQIDEEIEDSWIIFAKSLYKLGEKKMAIKTLNSYIKSSESIKASILLTNMRKGTFK